MRRVQPADGTEFSRSNTDTAIARAAIKSGGLQTKKSSRKLINMANLGRQFYGSSGMLIINTASEGYHRYDGLCHESRLAKKS